MTQTVGCIDSEIRKHTGLTSPGNKQVIYDTVKLLADEQHYVRLAAAQVLAHLAPDDPATVTLIIKFVEGVSAAEEKKKQAARSKTTTSARRTNTSRNTSRGQTKQVNTAVPEKTEEPEEPGREWIGIMAGVHALQLLVGDGAGREQLLKELPRLFVHHDITVRQTVVEIMHGMCAHGKGRGLAARRQVMLAAAPFLHDESSGAREVALQVIAGVAEGGQNVMDPVAKEYVVPVLACMSDTSWAVRHEATLAVIQLFRGCSEPAHFTPLITAVSVAPLKVALHSSAAQGLALDEAQRVLKSCEGHAVGLALDALRVLSECNVDLRCALGEMIKTELCLLPSAVQTTPDECEGTWLLRQPVCGGLAILLESRIAQHKAVARFRATVHDDEVPDGGERGDASDVFSQALRKFQKAAQAHALPDIMLSDELMDLIPDSEVESALAPPPATVSVTSRSSVHAESEYESVAERETPFISGTSQSDSVTVTTRDVEDVVHAEDAVHVEIQQCSYGAIREETIVKEANALVMDSDDSACSHARHGQPLHSNAPNEHAANRAEGLGAETKFSDTSAVYPAGAAEQGQDAHTSRADTHGVRQGTHANVADNSHRGADDTATAESASAPSEVPITSAAPETSLSGSGRPIGGLPVIQTPRPPE